MGAQKSPRLLVIIYFTSAALYPHLFYRLPVAILSTSHFEPFLLLVGDSHCDFQSHTCGVFVPLNNASYIFVIGGWDANLDYVDVVEVSLKSSVDAITITETMNH